MTTQQEKNGVVRLLNRSPRTKVEIAQSDPAEGTTVQDAVSQLDAFQKRNQRSSLRASVWRATNGKTSTHSNN